jgi:pyocin large subunit-like protein
MSFKATSWALTVKGLKPATKIVLIYLADRHNPDYGCFPSAAKLAQDCEMTERSVFTHLAELERLGLISKQHRTKANGIKTSNEYTLHIDENPDMKNLHNGYENISGSDMKNFHSNLVSNNLKKNNTNVLSKKGTRWTAKSNVEQEWINWAIEQGLSEEAARLEADKFSDYWIATTGAKATKLNWFATWRNWVRNAQKKTTPRKVVNIFDDPKYFRRAN